MKNTKEYPDGELKLASPKNKNAEWYCSMDGVYWELAIESEDICKKHLEMIKKAPIPPAPKSD